MDNGSETGVRKKEQGGEEESQWWVSAGGYTGVKRVSGELCQTSLMALGERDMQFRLNENGPLERWWGELVVVLCD